MTPRSYDVRVATLAILSQPKWVDNLLSHHSLPGVERARQGVERRISGEGLVAMEMVRLLWEHGGFTVGRASEIVTRALAERTESEVRIEIAPGIELRMNVREVEERLRERLAEAIDAAPRVKRGRPPVRAQTKTPDA